MRSEEIRTVPSGYFPGLTIAVTEAENNFIQDKIHVEEMRKGLKTTAVALRRHLKSNGFDTGSKFDLADESGRLHEFIGELGIYSHTNFNFAIRQNPDVHSITIFSFSDRLSISGVLDCAEIYQGPLYRSFLKQNANGIENGGTTEEDSNTTI